MTVADVESCTNELLCLLPEDLMDAVADVSIYVARDRQDLEILQAALAESGQTDVAILENFRAVFLGTPIDASTDPEIDADDFETAKGVLLLNASMLHGVQDVLDTLLHEIGHALGFDEEEIAALGLE